MATANPLTVLDNSTDAGFRAWITEHRDLLLTGGALAQTADTGQIDFGTVVRPPTNTDAAPLLLRFTDALQATAPYILAVYYGTDSVATRGRIRVAIGTGTNGSGALTGTILAATTITNTSVIAAAATTAMESPACGLPGEIAVAHKLGGASGGASQSVLWNLIGLSRTINHAGVQTAEGLVVYLSGSSGQMQCRTLRRDPPTVIGPSAAACLVPLETTSSVAAGGERQVYAHVCALPETRPVVQFVTGVVAEVPLGTVFPARPPGLSADRSYRSLGIRVASPGAGAGTQSHALCLVWQ